MHVSGAGPTRIVGRPPATLTVVPIPQRTFRGDPR